VVLDHFAQMTAGLWSWSRKKFSVELESEEIFGGVGVGKSVSTLTLTSI
jgi:hypothetical protein